MKKFILILSFVLFSFKVYSQKTEYNYTCGRDNQAIIWTVTRKEDLIYLETIQGNEVHKYAINHDYKTISWEYANISENTNLKVVLKNGIYNLQGTFKSKKISKAYNSNGYPWYQNIGFNVGHTIKGKANFKFECIRPDNLKFYEMQAEAKEIVENNGIQEQRINVHLAGMLAKYFGSNYYINCNTRQFVRYNGVHGPPGTPETIITLRK